MLIRLAAILVVSVIVISSAAAQSDPVEKVKLITSTGIDNFIRDLNEHGDAAASQGFRPVKILFARHGLLDFRIFFYSGGLNVIFER